MKTFNAIVLLLVLIAGATVGIAVQRGLTEACPEAQQTVTVRTDTVTRSIKLPVPYPVPGHDSLVYRDTGSTTTVYVTASLTDTLYADCDSARRYTLTHSDSNLTLTYTADVCGRLLAHNLEYAQVRHTRTGHNAVPVSASKALYATATSSPAIGITYLHGPWYAGYQYAPGNLPGWRRHELTVGIRLLNLVKRRP